MKRWPVLLAVLCLSASLSWAGNFFGERDVEGYDPVSGLLIKGVKKQVERGMLKMDKVEYVNLALFNPADNTVRNLFKAPVEGRIEWFAYEVADAMGEIRIFDSINRLPIYNQSANVKRSVRNRLWVATRSVDGKQLTIHAFNRDGTGIQHLLTFPAGSNWHVDWKASKIRLLKQVDMNVQVTSHDW